MQIDNHPSFLFRHIRICQFRRAGTSTLLLPPDTTHELNVLRHDSDTLGMNGAQVGVLK